jgi:hypothetical protein
MAGAVARASRAAASAAAASRRVRAPLADELTSPPGGPALVRWLSRVSLGISAVVIGSWAVLALARYMPLQFVLHEGVARTTGEYLVSGKLLAYGAAACLYVLAFIVYRRLSGSAVLATGLVAAVLCSGTGLEAATTVRGDALPAALQLTAVTLVAARRGGSPRLWVYVPRGRSS